MYKLITGTTKTIESKINDAEDDGYKLRGDTFPTGNWDGTNAELAQAIEKPSSTR